MSSIIRSPHLILIPALIVALGCASTSSAPGATESPSTPVSEAKDSSVDVSQVSSTLEPVYFDTDLAVLRPEARETLRRYGKSILDHPEWGLVRIEGHCDERGSDEYNLALGKRRAATVERYLVDRGVPRSRLATKTFGAQRPAVPGHDESAWRYNRRSELLADAVLASTSR